MRRAFTVVELLVVIAIIGVLTALTLPAVQMAREASRKATCAAHLKQIAIAAQAHNEAFEHFPNAGGRDGQPRTKTSSGTPVRSLQQDWGVFYQILPYVEQQALYTNTNDAEVAALKLKIYFCPTRRPPTTVTSGPSNGLTATNPRGAIDYAGSGGTGGPDPMGVMRPFSPMGASYNNSLSHQTGAIIPRPGIPGLMPAQVSEKISGASIRDGLSNVLMFGERHMHRKSGSLADEDNGYFNGWSWDTIRFSHMDKPLNDCAVTNESNENTRFGGPHSGVTMLAMCDGSVKAVRIDSLDTLTFRQLTHRSDGKFPQLQ